MTQRNRPAVHVDITATDRVTAMRDQKITGTSWDPGNGAREAQQRVEDAVKAQYLAEQQRIAEDPTNVRLARLEAKQELQGQQLAEIVDAIEDLRKLYRGEV